VVENQIRQKPYIHFMSRSDGLESPDRESRLLDRLASGDRQAFDELYRIYFPSVFRNGCMLLKDREEAEDIVQDTFLALWRNRRNLSGRRSIAGWLFITSHNRCMNILRRRQVDAKALHAIGYLTDQTPSVPQFEQQWALVEGSVAGLSARQQQALRLCKLQGKTYEEAAGIMEISKNTVKEYLSMAMDAIRRVTRDQAKRMTLFQIILSAWLGAA